MVLNNVKPISIECFLNGNRKEYVFSEVPFYIQNKSADKDIFTWELHSDDGSGHLY